MLPQNKNIVFRKGQIYNRHYVGKVQEYGHQNGHHTFKVIGVDTGKYKLIIQDLYCQFPDDEYSNRLVGRHTSYTSIKHLLKEYEIKEIHSRKDYIHHSIVIKPQEAIDNGLITKKTIKQIFKNQGGDLMQSSPVTCHTGTKKFIGYSIVISVEGEEGGMGNKYLQSVVFRWKTKKQMETEIRAIFPGAWFMD